MIAFRPWSLLRCVRWPLAALALLAGCGGSAETDVDRAEALVRANLDAPAASFSAVSSHAVSVGAGIQSTVVCGKVQVSGKPGVRFIVGAGAAVIEDAALGQAAFETTWKQSCSR